MTRDELYEEEAFNIPEGYEVEISAVNKLYTVAPAHLVPETNDWKLVVPDHRINIYLEQSMSFSRRQ